MINIKIEKIESRTLEVLATQKININVNASQKEQLLAFLESLSSKIQSKITFIVFTDYGVGTTPGYFTQYCTESLQPVKEPSLNIPEGYYLTKTLRYSVDNIDYAFKALIDSVPTGYTRAYENDLVILNPSEGTFKACMRLNKTIL